MLQHEGMIQAYTALKKPLHCMKIDEICGATYNFGSAGIKYVKNNSYDIPSNSKLFFFCFKVCIFIVNMQKQQMPQSGLFHQIIKVPQLC